MKLMNMQIQFLSALSLTTNIIYQTGISKPRLHILLRLFITTNILNL
ncbi:hypothetical protein B6N60_02554 [Richelia sinica FACHB-800]|uniref:Uncharacterized protein n=1 Tax=Richelia sinica FACHB-800 TaxID=1357546 RepID=A0A975T9D7_9NOST|nr:hypothetical protein B6N60_02554 [Richelia sinica FACHB-800]